jgi:hypothetical protein
MRGSNERRRGFGYLDEASKDDCDAFDDPPRRWTSVRTASLSNTRLTFRCRCYACTFHHQQPLLVSSDCCFQESVKADRRGHFTLCVTHSLNPMLRSCVTQGRQSGRTKGPSVLRVLGCFREDIRLRYPEKMVL